MPKYKCPCCGYYTLETQGEYDICHVCFWEDDPLQCEDETRLGANKVNLINARRNYKEFGACEAAMLPHVRKPMVEDGAESDTAM